MIQTGERDDRDDRYREMKLEIIERDVEIEMKDVEGDERGDTDRERIDRDDRER